MTAETVIGGTREGSPSPGAAVVVCERSSTWAVALRRTLPLRVVETRTIDDFRAQLDEVRPPAAVIEFRADNALHVLRVLDAAHPAHGTDEPGGTSRTALLIATSRPLARYDWLLREMGAVHVLASTREVPQAAAVIRRILRRRKATDRTLREQLWDTLPWPAARPTRE